MSGRARDETDEPVDPHEPTRRPDDADADDADAAPAKQADDGGTDEASEDDAAATDPDDVDSAASTAPVDDEPDDNPAVDPELATATAATRPPQLAGDSDEADDEDAADSDDDEPWDDLGLPSVARDHYTIIEEHDRGGLGRIMKAKDTRTGRVVAIKEILEGRKHAAERFKREALITANLQHPAIVPVYEIGQWDSGEPFYAMKLVSGRSLADAIKDTKTFNERLAMLPHLVAVADAMAYAHSEGIIHRDMKPANVLVGSFGETVVIDWGLAKRLSDADDSAAKSESDDPVADSIDSDLTRAGAVMGTPAYMSPEQGSGDSVDERTDVYAIGAMLYHLLAGMRPYSESKSVEQVLSKLLSGPPKPISDYVDDVPADLSAIADKAMAHDPAQRYRTAGELADELRTFQLGKLVGAHSYTTWQLVKRWLARHKAPVAVAGVAAIILAVVGTVSVQRIIDARDRADAERNRAKTAEREAVSRLASLYAEQGRQALQRRHHDQAAVYLSKAYSLGVDTPGLRTLLARAMTTLDRRATTITIEVGSRVGDIAYARGGDVLLTNAATGMIAWDPNTGKRLATLDGAPKGVKGFRVSPDGTVIAAVTEPDGALRVWDARTFKQLWAVPKMGGKRNKHPVFSADGSLVAVATLERGVDVFEARSGAPKYWFMEPAAFSVAFTPDNKHVLIGTIDRRFTDRSKLVTDIDKAMTSVTKATMSVWDPDTLQKVRSMKAGIFAVQHIRVVNDREAVVLSGQSVQQWNYQTAEKLGETTSKKGLTGLELSPSKSLAVIAAGDDTLLWSVTERKPVHKLVGAHEGGLAQAGMARGGKLIYARGRDGVVTMWHPVTRGIVVTLAAPIANPGGTAMDPKRDRIAMATGETSVHIASYTEGHRYAPGKQPIFRMSSLSVSGDGSQVVVTAAKPTNALFRLSDHKLQGTLMTDATHPAWARFAKAAKRVAIISNQTVATFDPANGKQLARWAVKGKRLAISNDGNWVAAQTKDGKVGVWRADTAALAWAKPDLEGAAVSFRFGPHNKLVVATSDTGNAVAFRVSDGAATKLPAHKAAAYPVGFSPDGGRVMTVGNDRVARVSQTKTGRELFTLDGKIIDAAINATHIATGAIDGRISLHDARTGKRISSWRGSATPALLVRFDKTGGRLITSAQNANARVWDTTTGALLAELDGHIGPATFADFLADDDHAISLGLTDGVYRVWDFRRETRSPAQIHARIACLGLFRLDGDKLVSNKPNPARCK